MKKIVLLTVFLVTIANMTKAQSDTTFQITPQHNFQHVTVCLNHYNRAIIYAIAGCNDIFWETNYGNYTENPLILDGNQYNDYVVVFQGCGQQITFFVDFTEPNVPNETTTTLWKHQGHPIPLEAIGADSLEMYDFLWSTGETTRTINVTEPGVYTCEISETCGTATRTFIVRDNVEISLATCDLETNLNMVTWPTTPAQAEYVSQVEVKRDGMLVGTADYSDGYFIDNIGSDAASRTYTVTALATDGAPCPIASYPKETIHMAYLTGINNTIEVNWNSPTGYDLLGYNICEWHPGAKDGDLTVIDYVGAGVTSYTCSESMFDEGNIVVQGVEAGKDGESRLLSNRSWETVGIGEHQNKFNVYPNPTNGTFTVDGTTELTVFNTLGQTVTTSHSENGTHTFTLRSGIYFIKSDEGTVQKIVVE